MGSERVGDATTDSVAGVLIEGGREPCMYEDFFFYNWLLKIKGGMASIIVLITT